MTGPHSPCVSVLLWAGVFSNRFTSLRSMGAAWVASAVIWMKEVAVGVVFFLHKELSKDDMNQSVCFEHYPMHSWEYPINVYRFSVGFVFPLAILSVWVTTKVFLLSHTFDGTYLQRVFSFPDQLPARPSCCGSEHRDATRPEAEDPTASEQHHPHLPRVFLAIPHLPVSADSAGARLQVPRR